MICLKIRTFVVSATTTTSREYPRPLLWFAWKFVPLWYQQQPHILGNLPAEVVICLKIRTFVVSATTRGESITTSHVLWFAWKFVPLWYQQQQILSGSPLELSCDLLENSYLCGISNNCKLSNSCFNLVVICLKIRTFVVSATTLINAG